MADTVLKLHIKQRYDSEASWISKDPILLAGEIAISSDKNGQYKTGNGTQKWSELVYNGVAWTNVVGRPSTMKNPAALTISLNGSSQSPYDGSTAKTVNITAASIGAAPAGGSTAISKLASTITLGEGNAATILQNGATYQQKLEILDNSSAGDGVFRFSQSSDTGKSFLTLFEIRDDGNIVANRFTGALEGNAKTATRATTADRATTARNIKIGNTAKTVDLSKDVAWSLGEIGAAATSHTHSYLPLTGGTLTGDLKMKVGDYTATPIKLYAGDVNGAALITQGGGLYIAGSGESAQNLYTTLAISPDIEKTFISSDNDISFVVGCQAMANRKTITINTDGTSIFPAVVKAPTFSGALSGNASTATKLATARKIGNVSFDGTADISLSQMGAAATNHTHSYLPLGGGTISGTITLTAGGSTVDGTVTAQLKGIMGSNDSWRIGVGATASDSGFVEFATADNGDEPIYIRQYSGSFTNLKRTLTLLDGVGNSSFPGTITAKGFLGNATSASKAPLLSNLYASRPTSANIAPTGSGGLSIFKATSAMTEGKPASDSHVLHFFWDNTGGYDSQLAITASDNPRLQIRGQSSGTWGAWKTILSDNNYTSYTVTKTGGGASGTWGINISGNAVTATRATQDSAGNTITSKYVNLDTGQTISGAKEFTSEVISTSANGFRIAYGNYGLILRNDGANSFVMLTNSGDSSGTYNSLRPVTINNSNGYATIGNGLRVNGTSTFSSTTEATSATAAAAIFSGGVGVAKQIVSNGKLYVGHSTAANAIIYLNGKEAIKGFDSWLRINQVNAFSAGVYFGTSIVRTDGTLQVGDGGSSVNITASAIQLKKPTTISNTAVITNTTASTSKTTGALKVSGGVGVAGAVNSQIMRIDETWTLRVNAATKSLEFVLA